MADLKRALFGYRSSSVRSELDRVSKNASEAERRAERLSAEVSLTKSRLAGVEEQLKTSEERCAALTADLERAVAERGSMEGQLRAAQAETLTLREELRRATAEAAESRESLRVLDESGGYEAAMGAQQKRVAELEELVRGYRELIEGGTVAAAPSAEPSDVQEAAPPKTAKELAAVIEVAEQAVTSIMESTRARAEEELRAVDEERERIRRDVETMTAWRDRAAPMIASLQAAMHEIQNQGAEIGHRVDEALAPVSTTVTALTSQLASLDDLEKPPSAVTTDVPAPPGPDRVTRLPDQEFASRNGWDR